MSEAALTKTFNQEGATKVLSSRWTRVTARLGWTQIQFRCLLRDCASVRQVTVKCRTRFSKTQGLKGYDVL